jgi:uncharacterized protein YjeT (DUF2065 family)
MNPHNLKTFGILLVVIGAINVFMVGSSGPVGPAILLLGLFMFFWFRREENKRRIP